LLPWAVERKRKGYVEEKKVNNQGGTKPNGRRKGRSALNGCNYDSTKHFLIKEFTLSTCEKYQEKLRPTKG